MFYVVLVDNVPMAVTEIWARAQIMRDEMNTKARWATILPVREINHSGFYDESDYATEAEFTDEEPTIKE